MNDHHLIMGQLVDFLTGRTLDDTHDERYRQKIAQLLVTAKGYDKAQIRSGRVIELRAGPKRARVAVAFMVAVDGRTAMLIHYGPGSLTTRHRPALALARLAAPYQIPVVVVTNGEQADILNGRTGATVARGLADIPSFRRLRRMLAGHQWTAVSERRAEMEARIAMAYEVDDRCPCDTDVCSWIIQEQ